MGHEAHIVCPYCSTLFVHDHALKQTESDPPGCIYVATPRQAHRRLEAASSCPSGRACAHCRRRHRRTCGFHRPRPARDRDRDPRTLHSPRDRGRHPTRPQCYRALAALGVLDVVEPHAFRPEAILIYDGISGRRLHLYRSARTPSSATAPTSPCTAPTSMPGFAP
jgi:hypothetical protein